MYLARTSLNRIICTMKLEEIYEYLINTTTKPVGQIDRKISAIWLASNKRHILY